MRIINEEINNLAMTVTTIDRVIGEPQFNKETAELIIKHCDTNYHYANRLSELYAEAMQEDSPTQHIMRMFGIDEELAHRLKMAGRKAASEA